MKPNELRIGNIVMRKSFMHESTPEGKLFYQTIITPNDIQACLISPEHFNPIPLTEEWLVKLGLIKENFTDKVAEDLGEEFRKPDIDEDGNVWYYWVKGLFNLEIQNNGEIWFEIYSHYKHLEYVHQLQNLYFILTDEELTIK